MNEEREQAIETLKKILVQGDTVYGVVRSVARSGLSRTIDFYVIKYNSPVYLTGYMSKVLKMPRAKGGALRVAGVGMNMIFACVYELSISLFDKTYALKNETL